VAGEHEARRVRELFRKTEIAALCRRFDPEDPSLAGALYDGRGPLTPEETWLRQQGRLAIEVRWFPISGGWLGSSAPTAFTLDGRTYASVFAFWRALQYAEDDPRRAETAAGRHPRRGRRGDRFTYEGARIAVNSPEHGALVGRATEAKVLAHAEVRAVLAATGTERLTAGPSVLGRYMAFTLMVMRVRLFRG
jgi:hypothetical protein